MKTYSATPRDIEHDWYIVDAEGMVLGRLALRSRTSSAASTSRCTRRTWTRATTSSSSTQSKVRVTGKKAEQKRYFQHTGYMGHERFTPFATMLEKHPERVIEKAVYGMLPKTALGRQSLRRKLRVFADAKHTHAAQQPKVLDLNKKSETK